MGLWEFTFALSAVILGLALTNIAATIQKLLLAGKRVRWAPEPILLTTVVLLVIVGVWLTEWFDKDLESVTIGQMLLQVAKLLTLYFAAASCLPEPEGNGSVDLLAYFDQTRLLSFGALILSYFLFQFYYVIDHGWPESWTIWTLQGWFMYPALYGLLILFRRRWLDILVLSFAIVRYAWSVVGLRLTA
jgi:hypothetical protein